MSHVYGYIELDFKNADIQNFKGSCQQSYYGPWKVQHL